jgi:hypothetical protein
VNESLGADPAGVLNRRLQVPVPDALDDIDQATDSEPPYNPPREGLPHSFRMRHDKHYVEELMSSATSGQAAARATNLPQGLPADAAIPADDRRTTDDSPRPSAEAVELIASRLESIVAHSAVSRGHAASADPVSRMMQVELQRVSRWARAVSVRARQIEPVRRLVTASDIAVAIRSACTHVARLNGMDCLVTTNDAGFAIAAERALVVQGIAGTVDALLDLMHSSATGDSPDEGGRIIVSLQSAKVPPTLIVDVECPTLTWRSTPADRFFDNSEQDFALAPVAGILLASAAHVVRLHGGRVSVRLRPGVSIRYEFPQETVQETAAS